ncbi:MAG: hypothetical protein QXW91_05330 [Candidatus Nitrosotenuis sp.]
MPLSINVLSGLDNITLHLQGRETLTDEDERQIKEMFLKILEQGEWYDVGEIDEWLSNNTRLQQKTAIRITNISHYVQTRFQQRPLKLKVLADENDSCDCN